MAKVILIAAILLLTAGRTTGLGADLPVRGHSWPTPVLPVSEARLHLAKACGALLVPAFAPLVFLNRVDAAAWPDAGPLAGSQPPSLAPLAGVSRPWGDEDDASAPRVAVLSQARPALERARRVSKRRAQGRKQLWPPGRPLRTAQVWLARKQP